MLGTKALLQTGLLRATLGTGGIWQPPRLFLATPPIIATTSGEIK